jgi:hypothetical protein
MKVPGRIVTAGRNNAIKIFELIFKKNAVAKPPFYLNQFFGQMPDEH